MLRPRLPTSARSRSGFLVIDAIAGLLLIGVVGALLVAALFGAGRVQARLADEREAARLLERALIDLSAGQPLPPNVKLEDVSPEGASPRWVRVTVTHGRGRQMSLTGVVGKGRTP